MSDLHLRQRTPTELIDAAFALYRSDFGPYLTVSALAQAPVLLIELMIPAMRTLGEAPGPLAGLTGLVRLACLVVLSGIVTDFGSRHYLAQPRSVGDSASRVLPLVGPMALATFGQILLIGLGALALIVGAFYVMARFFAVQPVIVLEGSGSGSAFARSSALTQGHKRHVLNTLMLAFLISMIAGVAAVALSALLGSGTVVIALLGSVVGIFSYPFIGLTTMLLYYDLRIRTEAFDLEQMTDALPSQPVP